MQPCGLFVILVVAVVLQSGVRLRGEERWQRRVSSAFNRNC